MSITIKDLAKIAGVSHTTVSRALNDNPIIKLETRQRIKSLAKEHNYIPNYNAKSLKLDRSFNIGLFFTSIEAGTTTSFFHDAIKGCHEALKGTGFNLVVKSIEEYNKDFSSIDKKRLDGVILVSQSDHDDVFIDEIINKEMPIVVVNRQIQKQVNNIYYNDRKGVYEAVSKLIELGHKKVGFIKGKEDFRNSHERYDGYINSLKDHDIHLDDVIIVNGDFDIKSGYEAMTKIIESKVSAVFCSNDEMAVGAIKAVRKVGLKVPEDVAIIGFDNTSLCEFATPTITSVERSIEKMAKLGTEKLLLELNTKTDIQNIELNCELIIREST